MFSLLSSIDSYSLSSLSPIFSLLSSHSSDLLSHSLSLTPYRSSRMAMIHGFLVVCSQCVVVGLKVRFGSGVEVIDLIMVVVVQ